MVVALGDTVSDDDYIVVCVAVDFVVVFVVVDVDDAGFPAVVNINA